jgi:ankyrin repeat protein
LASHHKTKDAEQIVGRERRERVSHHNWSGDARQLDARDDEGRSALFFADVGSKIFASLVAAGADIKARDCQGNTILMQRVSCSPSVAEVEELLRLGVQPEVRNQAGESALDLTVSLGLLNVVERLKSSPAG